MKTFIQSALFITTLLVASVVIDGTVRDTLHKSYRQTKQGVEEALQEGADKSKEIASDLNKKGRTAATYAKNKVERLKDKAKDATERAKRAKP